jgi:hypothetical protein
MSALKIDLTPEQIKSLKLFTYYCRGYGAQVVHRQYDFQYGNLEYDELGWSSPQLKSSIDSYDRIDDLIFDLIEKYEIGYMGNNDENYLQVLFEIDCLSNTLLVTADEEGYEYDTSGDEYEIDDHPELKSYFEEILSEYPKVKVGRVDFSGGGDDGYINDEIELDIGKKLLLPESINMFLYEALESHQGGWEIDDGSQGDFSFDFESGQVILNFELNIRDYYRVDTKYQANF